MPRGAEGRDVDGNYGERGLTLHAMRRIDIAIDRMAAWPTRQRSNALQRRADALQGEARREDWATFGCWTPATWRRRIHDGVRYTFIFEIEHYTD